MLGMLFGLTLPLILTGCVTTTASGPTDASFCDIAKPFRWKTKDTDTTIAQAKEWNAVGKSNCGWGKK